MSSTMETPETAQYGEFNTWSGVFSRPGSSRVTGVESVTSLLQTDPRSESGGRKRSSARCEAELIQARGRISQLELQLELGKTQQAAKRARRGELEEERESERHSLSTSRELQRLHTLDEERQSLAKQLAEAQESLRERERGDGEEVARLRTLVTDLERKQRESTSSTEELHAELSSLGNENRLLRRQLEVARKEVVVVRESLEGQLETRTEAVRTLRERVAELSGVRENWEAEQERVKELQHKLKQAKHNIAFAESVQDSLLQGETRERELRQLQEENAALRSRTDNVGLMRYQLQTLREQLERNEDTEKKAVKLEEENRLLREQLSGVGEDGTAGVRYSGLHSRVRELQHREVVLQSQVGEMESKLKLAQMSAERAESSLAESKEQLAREQEECKVKEEKIQRLEKRLLFVSKLRDGCVNVLNSYRLESGVDGLLKQNLAEVERQLASANERITELESEVERLSSLREKE